MPALLSTEHSSLHIILLYLKRSHAKCSIAHLNRALAESCVSIGRFLAIHFLIWYLRSIRCNVLWLTGRPASNASLLYVILGFIRTILKRVRSSRSECSGGRPIRAMDKPCGRWGAFRRVSRTVDFGRFNAIAI